MKVELYLGKQLTYDELNGERLDLFDDEKISLTLKSTDINNISKNYADFTQTFTVPASPKNNNIFKHWFDININNMFDANRRVLARLDIDSVMFRIGKVQLEKVVLTKGIPDYYSITFYSNLINLKDKFGDDTLNQLGFVKSTDNNPDTVPTTAFNTVDFNYSDSEVYNRINQAPLNDVAMPLGSFERNWSFGNNNNATDIKYVSTSNRGIAKSELRPAVTLSKIVEAISQRYGMSFGGEFFESDLFKKLFMWANRNEYENLYETDYPTYTQPFVTIPSEVNNNDPNYTNRVSYDGEFITIVCDDLAPNPIRFYGGWGYAFTPVVASSSIPYKLLIYNELGEILAETPYGTGTKSVRYEYSSTPGSGTQLSTIKTKMGIKSQEQITGNATMVGSYYRIHYFQGTVDVYDYKRSENNSNIMNPLISLINNLPSMKVSDFISGLVKMFNLVIVPDPLIEGKFNFLSLNSYYGNSDTIDLTDYVNIDKITLGRQKIFKNLIFKTLENKYIFNKLFKDTFFREFGDESLKNIEGGEDDYTIETKLGVMYNVKLSTLPILSGLGEDAETPLFNVPIIFAFGGLKQAFAYADVDERLGYQIKASGGISAIPINYSPYMGTDYYINDVYTQSITFSEEYDYMGVLRPNTLYRTFYEKYVSQIYNVRARIWEYDVVIPKNILYRISMDDTIIIRDVKFSIIDMTVDLLTGEGKLKLLNLINNGL